jgi:hypothetical protein
MYFGDASIGLWALYACIDMHVRECVTVSYIIYNVFKYKFEVGLFTFENTDQCYFVLDKWPSSFHSVQNNAN